MAVASVASLHRSWSYDLTPSQLYALLELRVEVFVVEQKCAYPELDGRDLEPETRHFWLESDGDVIGTLRLLEEHDDGKTFRIGRLCTRKDVRGEGHTSRLLQAALAEVGNKPCVLHAQSYLVDMYAKHGFKVTGDEYLLDGIPHVPMQRGGY
ncbi:MAG TPA: GNAT family N-acetyltransferase [Aldersonia sp.]